MSDKPYKIRIGLMAWPWFSLRDRTFFYILSNDKKSDVEIPVYMIEADTLEEARQKTLDYVNKSFDGRAHVEKLEQMVKDSMDRHNSVVTSVQKAGSLSIGKSRD